MEFRADGLTPQSLQFSRKSWWDDVITRLLLEVIPLDIKLLVEMDCGLAGAAHSLLPSLPDARYFGADPSPERLAEARTELLGARFESRVELRLAASSSLPLDDGVADLVLNVMAIQHKPDVEAVLAEALRVLRPRGRMVAVEPDNLGQRFYFDGGLEEISSAMHALCLRARVIRQPADIAIGPRLPSLMMEGGMLRATMGVHMVHSTRFEQANAFFNRLLRIAHSIAEESGLPQDDPLVEGCEQAIKRCLFSGLPKRLGFSCHLVPVFICVGHKP